MKRLPEIYVRLSTEYWSDSRGIYQKRCIKYLKRKSSGFNQLKNEADMGGIDLTFLSIRDFNKCKDGVHKVLVHAVRDFETGYCDDIDDIEYTLEKVNE